MSFKFRALLPLLVLSLASCRGWVLEDRAPCPRLLYFDIENAGSFEAGTQVQVHAYSHPNGQSIRTSATTVRDIQDHSFSIEVKATCYVKGFACLGADGLAQGEEGWTIPSGKPYPPLFRFSYLTSVPEESGIVPVEMLKEYAGVRLQFVGGRNDYVITVHSNTCGIRPDSGKPVPGRYEYRPLAAPDGSFSFNLARPCDGFLTLELDGGTGFCETLDLYRILREEGGVNWEDRNLPDVALVIDRVSQTIGISVMPWDGQDLAFDY